MKWPMELVPFLPSRADKTLKTYHRFIKALFEIFYFCFQIEKKIMVMAQLH